MSLSSPNQHFLLRNLSAHTSSKWCLSCCLPLLMLFSTASFSHFWLQLFIIHNSMSKAQGINALRGKNWATDSGSKLFQTLLMLHKDAPLLYAVVMVFLAWKSELLKTCKLICLACTGKTKTNASSCWIS